jgi:bacterial/archaeal transporter family protein
MGWALLAVVSAIAAGITSVFAKAGLEDVPSHLGNAVRTGVVLALSLGVLVWSGEHQKTGTLTGRAWLFLGLSGLATAVSWVAYFKALSIGDATRVTAIDKASLVVTMVLAIMFLGERFSWKAGMGVALIVAGSLLASAGK